MDLNDLEQIVKKIYVATVPGEDVVVLNKSPLEMIGKGRQGAVFRFTDDIALKVYGNPEDCEREYYALSLGQHTNLLPKIYKKGENYIAMEMVKGIDLREYLQSQPLTEQLSQKLIEMLLTFKEIGYERIDHHKRQIYIQDDLSLKVIDVGRTVWRDRVYPYPRKLLNSLGEDYKQTFLEHVKKFAPKLYEEWQHYIQMEEIAKTLARELMKEKINKKRLKHSQEALSTLIDPEVYNQSVENLFFKIFKEEWVRIMLARGADPDEIIDRLKREGITISYPENLLPLSNEKKNAVKEKKKKKEWKKKKEKKKKSGKKFAEENTEEKKEKKEKKKKKKKEKKKKK